MVAEGGDHQEQVRLLDIADSVNLVDAPVLGFRVRIIATMIDERMVVGGDQR